jgi:hypothetical protein
MVELDALMTENGKTSFRKKTDLPLIIANSAGAKM